MAIGYKPAYAPTRGSALLKSECSPPPPVATRTSMVMMRTADPPMAPVAPMAVAQEHIMVPSMVPGSRTIEPIYSFGPVHVNGVAGAYNPLAVSSGSAYSGSGYGSSSASYSPASYQLSAASVMPYALMHHQIRRPIIQHAYTSHSTMDLKPDIVYYEAPEPPIYIAQAEGHHYQQQAQQTQHSQQEEVALYCQPMKSSDLVKALASDVKVEKSPVESHEGQVHENIKKVYAIKDEITQLNHAAEKIAEQQEKLARMQNEHYVRSLPLKGMDPLRNMGYREEHSRMGPMMYGPMAPMGPMRPLIYRDADNQKTPEEASKNVPTAAPTTQTSTEPPQQAKEVAPEVPRQMGYGGYGYGGYGYPYGVHYRSETGFPVPSIFGRQSSVAPHQPTAEDAHFFMRLLDYGRRMGYVSNEAPLTVPQPQSAKAMEHKSENTLQDLMYGSIKPVTDSKEVNPQEGKKESSAKGKRDQRGMVMKKKEE